MKLTNHTKMRVIALIMAILAIASTFLVSCNNQTGNTEGEGTPNETPAETPAETPDDKPKYNVITIAEALELCGEPGDITTERYYIRGTIETVTNAQYGAMIIKDETGSISVYGTYGHDGEKTYTELDYQPVKGDEVLLHCILQNYNGTKEVKNARLIEYVNNQGNIDISNYTPASVTEARNAAKGAWLKVDGVVARITYANGMKPNGFILVDEGASIYVYDADAAQRVKIGNKVEIAGEKDYWILDSEQANAQKFGYKGCNQLTKVTLVSNDGNTDNVFNTSWIEESTVRDIVEAPVSEDITTKIFKVTTLVKKVPGSGFVNYYFYDLDGETGTYTYTQCNGSDFAWLDQFDGKICTVYLMALNAKSTSTGCNFRFLPVEVYDEGFKFDVNDTAEHVVKYYGLGQFKTNYTGNPQLEVLTKVSSELLGFKDAAISYTSDNTASVAFTEKNGVLVMDCLATGKAKVTVSVTYNGKTYSETIEISVTDPASITHTDVKTAIGATVGDIVTVKGIVGPSLVNKNGFYLIDETGMIAVIVNDKAILGGLEVGQEVILKGKRDLFHSKDGNHYGQTCITAATVEANLYGKYDYNTSNFIKDRTLADIYNLNVSEDHTTEAYIVKATVKVEVATYYTNIKLTDGTINLSLYCSSADQYSFLKAYDGQEITVEIAPCNWNDKKYYTGCVLALITSDGKTINTLNFDVN